jgi:uncharacterized protein with HEPN domain
MVAAVDRIAQYTAGMDATTFADDQRTVDAVVRNLEVIGEAARYLPDNTRALAPEIEWAKIVGLRNILVHQYFGVSTAIVWDVVAHKLGPLRQACIRLLANTAPDAP